MKEIKMKNANTNKKIEIKECNNSNIIPVHPTILRSGIINVGKIAALNKEYAAVYNNTKYIYTKDKYLYQKDMKLLLSIIYLIIKNKDPERYSGSIEKIKFSVLINDKIKIEMNDVTIVRYKLKMKDLLKCFNLDSDAKNIDVIEDSFKRLESIKIKFECNGMVGTPETYNQIFMFSRPKEDQDRFNEDWIITLNFTMAMNIYKAKKDDNKNGNYKGCTIVNYDEFSSLEEIAGIIYLNFISRINKNTHIEVKLDKLREIVYGSIEEEGKVVRFKRNKKVKEAMDDLAKIKSNTFEIKSIMGGWQVSRLK